MVFVRTQRVTLSSPQGLDFSSCLKWNLNPHPSINQIPKGAAPKIVRATINGLPPAKDQAVARAGRDVCLRQVLKPSRARP